MDFHQGARKRTWTIGIAGILLCSLAKPSDPVRFPADYRKWEHVKSVVIGPQSPAFAGSGGIHHIYANEPAMEGYRSGKFADGSVIVFDLLATEESGGNTTEGSRKRVDVMRKDGKRYAETGGWGFETFLANGQANPASTDQVRAACFACHQNKKDHDFVFSEFRP